MDRLTMVTELTRLAEHPALCGDDRTVGLLRSVAGHLMDVHGDLLKVEERRRKDRARKAGRSKDSTESTESTDSVEKGGFPPDPLSSKNLPPQHNTAREAEEKSEVVEVLTASLARRMGDLWPDADAFLKRRQFATWEGWLREMGLMIGGGSQFTVEDLAQVCRDDSALDRPIATPKGLRIFLGSARNERLNPRPSDGRQRGTSAQRTYDNGMNALKDIA